MGNIPPPMIPPQVEEFYILCKALYQVVEAFAQPSTLQQRFMQRKLIDQIPNSGRIILFSSSALRNFDQIQDFLAKAIEEFNRNLEQFQNAGTM